MNFPEPPGPGEPYTPKPFALLGIMLTDSLSAGEQLVQRDPGSK